MLAFVLLVLIVPLRPPRWHYRDILLFLTMTSLPAWIHAIPVEMMMPMPQAQSVNAWFLAIVATWRVILLVLFLKRAAGLSGLAILVATMLPLALIVTCLAMLNLEHVVFNIMAGNGPVARSGNDGAYSIVMLLTMFSFVAAPFLLAGYLILVVRAIKPSATKRVP